MTKLLLLAACLLCTSAARAAPALPWFDGTRPSAQAQSALAVLADAPSHGLDARDYDVPALQHALDRAMQDPPLGPEAAAQLDQALTTAMLRLLQDLHGGRVAPAPRIRTAQRDRFDAAAALQAALALQDLPLAVRQAVPPLAQYERLREALASYRMLAGHGAWQQALPPLPRALEPGAAWPAVPLLAARLAALGDLPADASQENAGPSQVFLRPRGGPGRASPALGGSPGSADAAAYDAALVAAVRAFQQRHGLDADGVIGRATWAALQVPPSHRVRQLELALERLRSTPLLQGPRMIVVNIPEFVLRAYEVQGERIVVKAQMKVIVGQALDTRTPLIGEDLRRIEFKPYWNVPASIARKELVPRLKLDPEHWAREGFEFVGAGGADAVLGAEKLQAVLDGHLRIRQRPGPRNALGDIKFVFPNRESIYLHHTPSVGLFERARRDFSHGCIRVEQPLALAAFALQGNSGWNETRIEAAMTQAAPLTVQLASPVPVLIAYGTALVKDGRVHFFDDLYGHDRALDAALRRRPVTPRPAARSSRAPSGTRTTCRSRRRRRRR
jgi:L,D-transpeptidase YcbB